jgi:hypothetical protein
MTALAAAVTVRPEGRKTRLTGASTWTCASDVPAAQEHVRSVAPLRDAYSAATSVGESPDGSAISCAAARAAASAAVWAVARAWSVRITSTDTSARTPATNRTPAASRDTDPSWRRRWNLTRPPAA